MTNTTTAPSASGFVCGVCSRWESGRRIQVRHASVAEIRACSGPRPAPVPVVEAVAEFLPVVEAPAPAPAPRVLATGDLYELDGELYRLRKARGKSHFYAGRLVSAVAREQLGFEYAGARPARRIAAGEGSPISAARAAELGRLSERCCFCDRPLSDDGPARSMVVGYGPVCAERRSLPWG